MSELAIEFAPELSQEIENATRDMEIKVARFSAEQRLALLEAIRPKLKTVKGFWTVALANHPVIAQILAPSDLEALKSLTDVELVQDAKDPRAYEVVFHFDDNEFFTNKTISKKYTLAEGTAAAPADGSITQELREFGAEDLVAGSTKIDWKEGKDLTTLHPRGEDGEGDDGSFFFYFTEEGDPYSLGDAIVDDVLADPVAAFEGEDEAFAVDIDELDEDDDDDDASVDLEDSEGEEDGAPAKKKQKQ